MATVVGLVFLGLLAVGKAADWLYGPTDAEPQTWPPWLRELDSSTAQVVERTEQSSEL